MHILIVYFPDAQGYTVAIQLLLGRVEIGGNKMLIPALPEMSTPDPRPSKSLEAVLGNAKF